MFAFSETSLHSCRGTIIVYAVTVETHIEQTLKNKKTL